MTVAVLAMSYGTPTGPEDILTFYTDIRRGRPPTADQLFDLKRRYEAIGGLSPMRERTLGQVSAIQKALDRTQAGIFTVYYGAKHAKPTIEEAFGAMAASGSHQAVCLVLAPHYSALSVGEYLARARTAAKDHGISLAEVDRWGDDPILIDLLAQRVRDATASLAPFATNIEVVFSAHSLPARVTETGDPYEAEIAQTAALVSRQLDLDHYHTGWQSAGRTAEPWLGPDILVLLEQLRDEGFDGVVVCPAGFTSDHLEVLYDLDIEAKARADALGLAFARTRSLNDDPAMAKLLARRVIAAADTRWRG